MEGPYEMKGPIIIVEDDADDQYICEEICRKLGVKNERKFFSDADSALSYLRQTPERPFIILCDINMPQHDGIELRKTINAEEQLRSKSIPFVFFSTAANPSQVRKAYDLTVQGFFIKEQRFSEALSTLKLIFDYWSKCYHPNMLDENK